MGGCPGDSMRGVWGSGGSGEGPGSLEAESAQGRREPPCHAGPSVCLQAEGGGQQGPQRWGQVDGTPGVCGPCGSSVCSHTAGVLPARPSFHRITERCACRSWGPLRLCLWGPASPATPFDAVPGTTRAPIHLGWSECLGQRAVHTICTKIASFLSGAQPPVCSQQRSCLHY